MDATPALRVRAGGDALLDLLPPSERHRLLAAAAGGDTHADLWRRHVDGTGGNLLWVAGGPPLVAVMNSHNMAFYVWEEALRRGRLRPGAHAVHVDLHPDFFEPEAPLPPPSGPEESLALARRLRWNDWQTAAFARGVVDRITDLSRGDVEAHRPPYVAVPVPEGMRYLEAGQPLGEAHPFLLHATAPVPGAYHLTRRDGLSAEAAVFRWRGETPRPADLPAALDLARRVAAEGDRLPARSRPDGGLLLRLDAGDVWILALATGDGDRVPPPLELRFDPDATELLGGPSLRRLERGLARWEDLLAHPPEPGPGGLVLDVDLDWLNVHREAGRTDVETVTPERVAALVRDLHRAVPRPDVVTIALSPECLAPRIRQGDLDHYGLKLPALPPEHLGMQEGRRRLALFLRSWRTIYGPARR